MKGDLMRCFWGVIRCVDNGKKGDGKPVRCFERLKGMPGMPSDRHIDEFRMMLITISIFVPFSLFWFCNSQMYTWGVSPVLPLTRCDAMRRGAWFSCFPPTLFPHFFCPQTPADTHSPSFQYNQCSPALKVSHAHVQPSSLSHCYFFIADTLSFISPQIGGWMDCNMMQNMNVSASAR